MARMSSKHAALTQKLHSIGLSPIEAKLYLVGLELGPSTVLELAKTAAIKRTTVYGILEKLVDKGIFEIRIHGWKKSYAASDPSSLKSLINKTYDDLMSLIPSLDDINRKKVPESILSSYLGIESIKRLYSNAIHTLEPNCEYLIIGNMDLWRQVMGEFAESFVTERTKICRDKNITIKALFPQNEYSLYQQQRQDQIGMQVQLLPESTSLNLATNYVVTPNTAIFHQVTGSDVAFATNNQYIIQTQKELFYLIWT